MAKKILAICAALVAFAAVPAVASASPELQTSGGTKVATGTAVKATNEGNIVLTTSVGNINCEKSELTGEVVENSGSSIKTTVKTASYTNATGGKCPSTISDLIGGTLSVEVTPENLHWCIESVKLGTGTIRGGGCAEASKNLKFTLHLTRSDGTAAGTCTYEKTTAVSGTYNTASSPLILSTSASQEFTLTAFTGTLCPTKGTLDAKYKIQTSTGGELKVV